MGYTIVRSKEEIDDLLEWVFEGVEEGTHYHGMSYEEGIRNTIDWLTGFTDDNPKGE